MKKIYTKPTIYVKVLQIESMLQSLSITTPNKDAATDETHTTTDQSSNPFFFNDATDGGGAQIGDKTLDF